MFLCHNSASTCEENDLLYLKDNGSPLLSVKIRELCNNLKTLCESTPKIPEDVIVPSNSQENYNDIVEPKTPATELKIASYQTPQGCTFSNRSSNMKVCNTIHISHDSYMVSFESD